MTFPLTVPQAKNDFKNALTAAFKMGIAAENIFVFHGKDAKTINKELRKLYHELTGMALEGKKVFVFAYCAGHGVEDKMHFFVTNSLQHQLLGVEGKLRALAKGSDGNLFTLAVFDCCRSPLSSFPNLSRGTGEDVDEVNDPSE